jgi:hypothetical protein
MDQAIQIMQRRNLQRLQFSDLAWQDSALPLAGGNKDWQQNDK